MPSPPRRRCWPAPGVEGLGAGPGLASSPDHDGCGEGGGGEEALRASVVAGCTPSPVLQMPGHDFDPVAAFVTAPVVFECRAARLPARDAWLYLLVLQRFSKPVGIIAPVGEQPLCPGQAAEGSCRAGLVANLACGHEEADRPPFGIGDSLQFGVHATSGRPSAPTPNNALLSGDVGTQAMYRPSGNCSG